MAVVDMFPVRTKRSRDGPDELEMACRIMLATNLWHLLEGADALKEHAEYHLNHVNGWWVSGKAMWSGVAR